MKSHYVTRGLAALFIFCSASARVHGDTLDALEKTYGAIRSIEAHFSQKISIKALKREREMEGDFFYKRSEGFLWKYRVPKEKTFLYDGTAIWQAEEGQPFVIRDRVDKARLEGTFLDLVDDVTRLDRLFAVRQVGREGGMEVLELVPRKEGTLKSARIWVDDRYLIRRMEIDEITGNTNVIEFSAIKIDKPVADSLFVFKVGGREIIDSRGQTGQNQPR
jgi:outer membrane lipoprotein-sorting protein